MPKVCCNSSKFKLCTVVNENQYSKMIVHLTFSHTHTDTYRTELNHPLTWCHLQYNYKQENGNVINYKFWFSSEDLVAIQKGEEREYEQMLTEKHFSVKISMQIKILK